MVIPFQMRLGALLREVTFLSLAAHFEVKSGQGSYFIRRLFLYTILVLRSVPYVICRCLY